MYIWTWLECFQIYADHHLDQGGTLETLGAILATPVEPPYYRFRYSSGRVQELVLPSPPPPLWGIPEMEPRATMALDDGDMVFESITVHERVFEAVTFADPRTGRYWREYHEPNPPTSEPT